MRVHILGKDDTPKLIVAGIPRTGTRYVTNKLGGKPYKAVVGNLIKTHGLAPPDFLDEPRKEMVHEALMGGGYKAIFMFGDPVASIISTINNIYDSNHFKNCGVIADPKNIDITKYDHLNYEMMFDSWMQKHPYPVMCIRYEKLPKFEKEFIEFTGVKVDFSNWKARKTDVTKTSPDIIERIQLTYGTLIEKVDRANDCIIYHGEEL